MSTRKKSNGISRRNTSSGKKYKEGTINGVRSSSKYQAYSKKKRQQEEYYSLVKMLCCAVCVLIMVFVINAIVRANFTFNGIYYEEPVENEVIEIVSSSSSEEASERVTLNLLGDLVVNLKVGEKYIEPGYNATSDLKGDITDYVKVTGEVDTSKTGTYRLIYTLEYRGICPKLTRLVNVSGSSSSLGSTNSGGLSSSEGATSNGGTSNSTTNPTQSPSPSDSPVPSSTPSPSPSASSSPAPSPIPSPSPSPTPEVGNITLTLLGDATVYIVEGSSYNDAGAKAVDNNGNDVSGNIVKSGSVNTNVAGTYKITYSIINYNGQVLTVVRNVVVQKMGITLTLDNNEYTNKAVNITIVANVDQFSNIVLPSGEKVTEKTYTYKVTKNGTYEFIVYNKNGDYRKASMVVKNIDKEKPKGKCFITHQGTGSIVTITATDNVGIASYVYSGTIYTTNVINFDRKIESGLQINVGFYDLAGNFSNCNCLSP